MNPKFKTGDWVAELEVEQPTLGRVRTVYDDCFDMVVYRHDGERLGRVSPPLDGPKNFEPCVPTEGYGKIQPPKFPLERNLTGGYVEELVWL